MTPTEQHLGIRFLFSRPQYFLALGFGAGLIPKAPGTAGAAVGILFYLTSISHLAVYWQLIVMAALFIIGWHVCETTGRAIGQHDHSTIVWDEIWAMAAVFVFIPASASTAVAAFFLFRLFDIWKPWPINRIEKRLQNGLGVMLDDLLAASYTVLTIVLAHRLFGWS